MERINTRSKPWLSAHGLVMVILAVGVIVTTACSDAAASATGRAADSAPAAATPVQSAAGAQQVTVTVGNGMTFEPTTISLQAHQPVELTLRNGGQLPHDFSLTDGVAQPVKITANGGQTASGSFTIDKPGNYTFDCSMPGHTAAGMRGTIAVQ